MAARSPDHRPRREHQDAAQIERPPEVAAAGHDASPSRSAPADSSRSTTDRPSLRRAVRALIVDESDAILLARFVFTDRQVWALPGGGLDPGETHEDGLRRELDEELGLTDIEIGPVIWRRTHMIPMGPYDGQRDTVHLVRHPRFDPHPAIGWDALRTEGVHEMRWWSLDELGTVPTGHDIETGGVRFAPRRLAALTRALIDHGAPPAPIETGV